MKTGSMVLRRGRQMVADLSSMGARDLGLSKGRANRASGIRSRNFFIPDYNNQVPSVFNKQKDLEASRILEYLPR